MFVLVKGFFQGRKSDVIVPQVRGEDLGVLPEVEGEGGTFPSSQSANGLEGKALEKVIEGAADAEHVTLVDVKSGCFGCL